MRPQMAEEEFITMINNIFETTPMKSEIAQAQKCGYIRKSDLEILIEECDEHHRKYRNIGLSIVDSEKFLDKLLKLVEMLKSELNKRRDI